MEERDTKQSDFDNFMFRETEVCGIRMQRVDVIFILCLFVFAFLIRWKLMPIESADYFGFLEDWMNQIREGGGFRALGQEISNYTSPYMYLMCLVSYVTSNSLYGLKMVSVVFDYLAGIAVFLILYHMTENVKKSVFGMAFLLLSPTVILDSAYWCQCDIIYTSMILFALYYFLKDNSKTCFIFLGIAFSFKLQTLFIVPFLLIMWLKRRTVRLGDFIWLPVIYVISEIPAWLLGRNFGDLMRIYFGQSDYYPWGTLEYPNIYALLDETIEHVHHAEEVSGAGTFMTVMILGVLAYYLYTRRLRLTSELMITLALFTVAVTVYSLPHMHDRYGFLIDLLAIIYGTLQVKRLPVACGFMLVSIVSFMPYLIAVHIVPIQYVAIFQLGLIIFVGYDLYRQVRDNTLGPMVSEEPEETLI